MEHETNRNAWALQEALYPRQVSSEPVRAAIVVPGTGSRLTGHGGDELVLPPVAAKGQAVRVPSLQSLAEEAGGAYKDVDEVVRAVETAGISKLVARMVPLGVVKG